MHKPRIERARSNGKSHHSYRLHDKHEYSGEKKEKKKPKANTATCNKYSICNHLLAVTLCAHCYHCTACGDRRTRRT